MLREADRLGFPVLLLDDDAAFDDLLNAVLTDVITRQRHDLQRTDTVHASLVSVVLDGGGLEELAQALDAQIEGDIAVTTTDGRVLAAVGDDDELLALDDLFVESGRFRSERFAPGNHQAGDVFAGRGARDGRQGRPRTARCSSATTAPSRTATSPCSNGRRPSSRSRSPSPSLCRRWRRSIAATSSATS